MLLSSIASFIITIFVFNFACFPSDTNCFSKNFKQGFKIFGAAEESEGKILGAEESVNEIAKAFLPESEDKPAAPQKKEGAEEFEIAAKSAVAIDEETGVFLFAHNPDESTPIASLTKLMTALVFLEYNPGWDIPYEIKREDRREGGRIYLFLGEKVTVKDLFYLSLVASDNTATVALAKSTGFNEEEFVKKMNEKAGSLGLTKTNFRDPVGLDNNNVSTAREIANLAKISLAHEDIRQATMSKDYQFKTLAGKRKVVSSTDYLLKNFPSNGLKIIGGKTGYTDLAGYCFAGKFSDNSGREIITAILGGKSSEERFQKTRDLAEWAYNSYVW
ncbi:MAG: serine hydrolase [Patescibacteria group bacterium]